MERDDIIEYSLDGHHSEEAGVKIRKKIWFVTALLTAITAVEVVLGMMIKQHSDFWPFVKWFFIILTIVKAAYIVLIFMHLGEERKGLKFVILIPYFIFMMYLIFILLWEGTAVGETLSTYGS
ncbi:MAG: cytochrome C oxidase subunit IV family protein [Crocinitomicaceae bacterium]|nr:cytochrome C oxidase subunit IV family protein [Crocinitomicaceae bacterium]